MHPQSGAGVDFDHDAALALQRPADVQGHDVDTGNVEADNPGRLDHAGGDFGVD